jgi:hypothetical protein
MRLGLVVALGLAASPAFGFCTILWPDDEIPVPELVRLFIAAECRVAHGTGPAAEECVRGEFGGYRATVMMLTDAEHGEKAASRYRACAAGLGADGGRFHRRRAQCIGGSLDILWRFGDELPA